MRADAPHDNGNGIEMKKEIWKDIPGYEGYYQASTCGRIRSVDRIVRQQGRGKAFDGLRKGRILKSRLLNSGYLVVWLCKDGKSKALTVHRLIADTFIPRNDERSDVNHKDGNKGNNNIENLERCTKSENIKHSYRVLKHKSPYKKSVVCVETGMIYMSISDAERDMELYPSSVSHVINGKCKTAGGYTWRLA